MRILLLPGGGGGEPSRGQVSIWKKKLMELGNVVDLPSEIKKKNINVVKRGRQLPPSKKRQKRQTPSFKYDCVVSSFETLDSTQKKLNGYRMTSVSSEHWMSGKPWWANLIKTGVVSFDDEFKLSSSTTTSCIKGGQQISFCGVGAHHQNGVAERVIQTVVTSARTMMLHQALLWPEYFDMRLWPFALDQAAYLYNRLPRDPLSVLSPLEIHTGAKLDKSVLRSEKVWGCPAYVLDPKLQDGKKLPKWDHHTRQGQYLD